MADSREYMTLPEENGSINIAEDVIAAIAVGAVREVEGVAGMMTSLGGSVTDLMNNRYDRRGAGAGPLPDRAVWPSHPRGGRKRSEVRDFLRGSHDGLRRGGSKHPCVRCDAGLRETKEPE